MKPELGVCYYPEHWSEELWPSDAERMAKIGLSWVRVGEFAWSRIEPKPGHIDFDWLDRAIDVLGKNGLKVVLGTPTATPPRWMIEKHPDMLGVDADGRALGRSIGLREPDDLRAIAEALINGNPLPQLTGMGRISRLEDSEISVSQVKIAPRDHR